MSSVTIQPSGIDALLIENAPTTNYGTLASLGVRPLTSNRNRAPLKFDFSAVVPAGVTIILATLSLYCNAYQASRTITAYRLLHTDWAETEATWNQYKAGSAWGTAGALNTDTDITTADAATAASVAIGQWLNVTVTAQVQTARDSIDGVAHFLMADVGATAAGAGNFYDSREATTEANRPKLYIEYTLPTVTGASFLLRMI